MNIGARPHSKPRFGQVLMLTAGLGCALVLGSCAPSTQTIRYRLTLEVEADGMVRRGSSVIETRWSDQSLLKGLANGMSWVVHTRGEAVIVDLGSRGILFALLTGVETKARGSNLSYFPEDPQQVLLTPFGAIGQGSITADFLRKLSLRRDVLKVPVSGLPMLVRFRDVHDPMTVEQVDPSDLEASFGPGVKLRGATIAITDDPVTYRIEEKLGWLRSLNGGYLTGKHASGPGLVGMLHAGKFERNL
jgi:hypothetical protein